MELYKVEKITEALYGCEECGADGPLAELTLVPLKADRSHSRKVELSEAYLTQTSIEDGKTVLFGADGKLRKYVKVVGAIIVKDGRIFATKRGYGEFAGRLGVSGRQGGARGNAGGSSRAGNPGGTGHGDCSGLVF